MEWQPIETAPRDGTQFLGYSAALGRTPMYVCWWSTSVRNGEPFICVLGGGEIYGSKMVRDLFPTHWMPLPEPPK